MQHFVKYVPHFNELVHKIDTLGEKIIPVFKKFVTVISYRMWKDDISTIIIICIIVAVHHFCKLLHCLCLTGFSICLWFWICEGFEYTRVTQGFECLNMPEKFLDMPNYAWKCKYMRDYITICLNMSKSDWMAFVLHVPIAIPCFNEVDSLKEHATVFFKRQNLIFLIVAGYAWFVFCFELNFFTSKIKTLFVGVEVARGSES